MDLEYVKQVLELIEKSGVNEIELEEEGKKIRITKSAPQHSAPMYMPPVQHQVMMPAPESTAPPSAGAESAAAVDIKKYHEIKSPIVGTFYRAPSPDAPPYVDIGSKVKQGSVLCIVEAMKLMNEIESDATGTIVKVNVENGKPVEYGQVLFLVEP
jgi:acetyl-CoA carboxylase biotin carboxyl carrier protein